jgi:hypothetical protein
MSRYHFGEFIVVGLAALLASCSSGPQAPEKGTPAFYWQAAKETSAAGEYSKTLDHLSKIMKTENEFKAKAQYWHMVLASGMAKGYMELADGFDNGARANKTNQMPFRRQSSDLRTTANGLALMFAESFSAYQEKNKDTEAVLAFPFPSASTNPVPVWAKASQGLAVSSDELESGLKANLKRNVLLATCAAVGAKTDVAKTQQMFNAGEVKVPRAVFVTAMANAMYEEAALYGPLKLNIPEKTKIFLTRADEALKSIPESKETKELSLRIDAEKKKAKN